MANIIKGLSGCQISVDGNILTKTAGSYSKVRLAEQAAKQINFACTDKITAPRIYQFGYGYMTMEYMRAYNFLEYAEIFPLDKVAASFNTLLDWIEQQAGAFFLLNTTPLKLKLAKIEQEIGQPINITLPNRISIPSGYCHGDLTLSNVMVNKSDNKLIFVDFLDSPVDSPLIDLAKLRQDTFFHWSLEIQPHNLDLSRLKILLEYFDGLIFNRFSVYDWYVDFYALFQQINLARLLPYLQRAAINSKEHGELFKKYYEYANNPCLW